MRKSLLLISASAFVKTTVDKSAFFLLVVFLNASMCLAEVTNTWDGSSNTLWHIGENWSDGVVPTNGQDVLVTNVANSILLTNDTADLASFVIISNTLTFTNWTTTLNASNVTIQSGATFTLPGAFTTNQMSNCVHIVCTNLTIASGSTIDADGKGYSGGLNTKGYGPGGGGGGATQYAAGGGYGGKGGDSATYSGGSTYGSANAPVPGSGGGGTSGNRGGTGGGLIRIEASGNATVNGTIMANGVVGESYTGGGSGGGIYIICQTFGGSNGVLEAKGEDGNGSSAGGGGGGRIAVWYGVPENRWEGIRSGTNMKRVSITNDYSGFFGTVSVTNGIYGSVVAEPGTIVFLTVTPPSGMMFMCQ